SERRATNKYYPPDWDPSKGSINKHVGQHPLRDRARKLDQGILIVRFELPYNIWCEGCEKHIGMGVRYNAEKKKVGMYYTTAIWSFRMKCHLCSSWIEIHTDPKAAEYVIISGARKREEAYKPEDIGVIALQDETTTEKLSTDAFYKLEHEAQDKQKAVDRRPVITQLQEQSEQRWKDPYTASQKIRKRFRVNADKELINNRSPDPHNCSDFILFPRNYAGRQKG
ncbi:CWC16 protein, partial [Blyttiomyces helicus]